MKLLRNGLIFTLLAYCTLGFATSSSPIKPYEHAKDFSWVSGQLHYAGVEGQTWTLTYDPKENKKLLLLQEDGKPYAPTADIKDGQTVVVRGTLKPAEMGIYMMGESYIVKSIRVLK